MRATRQRDTPLELRLRSSLYRLGLRYRIHRRIITNLSRTADIVFARARVAVFVDGCFWHGCTTHGSMPKTNRKWWSQKIDSNRRRDLDTVMRLNLMGWEAVRVWEHEDPDRAALRIALLVSSKNAAELRRS